MVRRPKVIGRTAEVGRGDENVYGNRDAAKGGGGYDEEKTPGKGKRTKPRKRRTS